MGMGRPINSYHWPDHSIPPNSNLADNIVSIQATQNGNVIYKTLVKTNSTGKFRAGFYSPSPATVKISAELIGHDKNQTADAVTSVVVTEAWLPAILLAFLITGAIASIVIFWCLYAANIKKAGKAWLYAGIVPTTVLTLFAYIILYKFPPADAAANTTIAAALITPLAAHIFGTLSK